MVAGGRALQAIRAGKDVPTRPVKLGQKDVDKVMVADGRALLAIRAGKDVRTRPVNKQHVQRICYVSTAV